MATCPKCGGEGIIITCCDDICVGGGHCIHDDGEELCPECDGEGWVIDDDDDYCEGMEGEDGQPESPAAEA